MKTHDIAQILHSVAVFFEEQPDKEFIQKKSQVKAETAEISVSHKLLIKMYNMDKHQWKQLADNSGLDVDIKVTDSKRDALFKVMRAIAESTPQDMVDDSTKQHQKKSPDQRSEQIAAALQFLLDRK